MLEDLMDRLIARLIVGAGLIIASSIAAVCAAMALFAFLSQGLGVAWAHVVVASVAALFVAAWWFGHSQVRKRHNGATFEQRALAWIGEHPSAAFTAGLAAGTFLKGHRALAAIVWRGRKTQKQPSGN